VKERRAALLTAVALCLAAGCGGESGSTESATTARAADTGVTTTAASRAAPLAGTVARVRRELRGIPQHSLVLGNQAAPVTIVEYGHFACPTCAAAHRGIVPEVIDRYVRTGKASLEFRGIGGDTPSPARDLALSAAAASAQRHGWDFVQLAYLRGLEKPGSAPGTPAESPARLATALGLDVQAWGDELARPSRLAQVEAAANVAAVARFSTYPVFLVRARKSPERPFVVLTDPGSVEAFAAAIAKAQRPAG
jgi:thioredoxin family protein